MAKYSPILADKAWFIGSDTVFLIAITDVNNIPLDLSGKILEFVVRTESRGTVLLTKIAPDVSLSTSVAAAALAVSNDAVNILVNRATTMDNTGNVLIPQGIYYYTLRQTNLADAQLLAYGPIVLRLAATR